MAACKKCGRILTGDEVAVTKKLVNRGATEFFCLDCLAGYFKVDRRVIEDKIRQFKEMGCTLFQ